MEGVEELGPDYRRVYWTDRFKERGKNPVTLELKVVLYLYLMMREADYGYNISNAFKRAMKDGKWENRTGLKNLLNPSKVSEALKYMASLGILWEYRDVRKNLPENLLIDDKIKRELKKNPALRIYYTINYDAIREETVLINVKTQENFSKYHLAQLGKGEEVPYSYDMWEMVRIIQLYGKTEQDSINFINKISKYDYLTILLTFESILHDLSDYEYIRRNREAESHNPEDESTRKSFKKAYKDSFFNDDYKMKQLWIKINKNHKKIMESLNESIKTLHSGINYSILQAIRYERRRIKN